MTRHASTPFRCVFLGILVLFGVACRSTPRAEPESVAPNRKAAGQQVSTTTAHATNEAAPSSTPEGANVYPPPAGPAAISLDEALRRTLAQLDPNAEPRVVTAGAITAGALAEEIELIDYEAGTD